MPSDTPCGCPPPARRCECCGREDEKTIVAITDSAVGPFCVTACPCCAAAIGRGVSVPVALRTAVRLAAQHAEHVAHRPPDA